MIGQVDFSSNGENGWQSVTHQTLCWPYGISFYDGYLAVADSGTIESCCGIADPCLFTNDLLHPFRAEKFPMCLAVPGRVESIYEERGTRHGAR